MKRFFYIGFVFFTILNSVLAQKITFNFEFVYDRNIGISDIIEDENGRFYFSAYAYSNAFPNYRETLIGVINNTGYLIDSLTIGDDSRSLLIQNIFNTSNGEYILTGLSFDSASSTKINLVIYEMNSEFVIIDTSQFILPQDKSYTEIKSYMEKDSSLLFSGGYRTGQSFSEIYSFVLVLNDQYDSIKFKEFSGNFYISQVQTLKDCSYWAVEEVVREISLLDDSLNKIQTIEIPSYIFGNYSVKWDTDTSFYLLGYNLYPPPNYNLSLLRFYHPIDTAGYLTSLLKISDTTDYPSLRGGLDFRHKDSIFVGGTRNLDRNNIYHSSQPSWFMLFQTDSLLNVRWERFYGGDAYYVMQKLIATRDGGCLVAGTRYDYMNSPEQQTDIIVLKLNSEGLLVGNDELPETRMHEAIVYPNPGTDALQIRLAVQHPTAMLELFDANGRLMLNQQLHQKESRIAVDHLPSGTYIYRLSADTGLLESGKWMKQ